MWRICSECGNRTDAFVCDRDQNATEIIRADTKFPGRLHQGDVLLNHYVVADLVGVGGMGAVYKGQQRETHQAVAIKVLWRDLAADTVEVRRFTREARAASLLAHPNAVRVIDFGSDAKSKSLFIIMEFLAGGKLSDTLRVTPMLEPARVVHICTQVCKALEEAHRKGIIHRDVKPDNIFLQAVAGERDFAKILDFGLAKFITGEYERDQLTRSGFVVGSPEYMAPEQASGSPVGPTVDLYSLGVVLYECLTGRLPFDAASTAEVLRKHILEGPPRLIGDPGTEHIPAALEEVVLRCLAKDPADRPPTADTLRIQLLQACDRRKGEGKWPIDGPLPVAIQAPGSMEESGPGPQAPTALNGNALEDHTGDSRTTVPTPGAQVVHTVGPQAWPTLRDNEVSTATSSGSFNDQGQERTPREVVSVVARGDPPTIAPNAPTRSNTPLAPTALATVVRDFALPMAGTDDAGRESRPLTDSLDRDSTDVLDTTQRPGTQGQSVPLPAKPPALPLYWWWLAAAVLVAAVLAVVLAAR
ncbi:MAG: serine/threonine protein kinase [Myxococcales bacterium]|nr:serine/threonine protein kinase [Myxococcales bacterium]